MPAGLISQPDRLAVGLESIFSESCEKSSNIPAASRHACKRASRLGLAANDRQPGSLPSQPR
jgi:hypothetical protein